MTLREWMEQEGVSALDLAQKLGISRGYLYKFLNGHRRFGKDLSLEIHKISKEMVPLNHLLYMDNE